MKALPYFKWYPADAETDANFRAMDDAEIGFYVRCLNHAWMNGGIPADPTERARCLRMRKSVADRRWLRVGKCFVAHHSDVALRVNPRQESERQLALQKSQVAMESAKRKNSATANALHARMPMQSVSVSSVDLISKPEIKPVSRARSSAIDSMIAKDWPRAAWALREKFPDVDDQFVRRLVDSSVDAFLDVPTRDVEDLQDEILADAIRCCTKPKQTSAGLYLDTVPQCIRTWAHDPDKVAHG